jgi:hypothetical protein
MIKVISRRPTIISVDIKIAQITIPCVCNIIVRSSFSSDTLCVTPVTTHLMITDLSCNDPITGTGGCRVLCPNIVLVLFVVRDASRIESYVELL